MSSSEDGCLKEKIAVVTGGAKGIGQACARALVAQGARVAILDTDTQNGLATADSLEGAASFFEADVSRSADVRRAFEGIQAELGDPTLLVNNAGIQHYGTVGETTEDEWDRVLAVNLTSAFLCSKAAIPAMQQAGGAIVNLASVQSFACQHSVAPYTTSKTALLGLTRSIAVDYAPRIRCNAVCPGTVDTPMLQEAISQSADPEAVLRECREMHPMKRIADPAEVADLIIYLLSDKAAFITGQSFRIDGGLGLSIGGSKN